MLVVEKKSLTSIVLVYTILIFVIATIVPIIVYAQQPQSLINQNKSSPENKVTIDKDIDMNKIDKYAIINFDDGFKGQYQYAKPVLDKYNFKATFFIVCEYIDENKKNRMTWDEIQTLANQGHDIESHSMSHKDLDKMSESDLNYEIGQSKQCLLDKGINSSIFAYPRASGSDISTVIDKVASIYDLARTGFPPVTFLKCDGWVQNSSQKDCRNGIYLKNKSSDNHVYNNTIINTENSGIQVNTEAINNVFEGNTIDSAPEGNEIDIESDGLQSQNTFLNNNIINSFDD